MVFQHWNTRIAYNLILKSRARRTYICIFEADTNFDIWEVKKKKKDLNVFFFNKLIFKIDYDFFLSLLTLLHGLQRRSRETWFFQQRSWSGLNPETSRWHGLYSNPVATRKPWEANMSDPINVVIKRLWPRHVLNGRLNSWEIHLSVLSFVNSPWSKWKRCWRPETEMIRELKGQKPQVKVGIRKSIYTHTSPLIINTANHPPRFNPAHPAPFLPVFPVPPALPTSSWARWPQSCRHSAKTPTCYRQTVAQLPAAWALHR